jgi:hypothetical protein
VITPGFTADAALSMVGGRYRHAILAPAPPERLSLAQGLAIYGRWCGPGHSGPGVPIDAVDEVCCRHDQCYCQRGEFDCSCDRELITNMPAALVDSSTPPEGVAAGVAAAAFFTANPFCLCHRICLPFVGCVADAPFPVPGVPSGPLKLCPPGFG